MRQVDAGLGIRAAAAHEGEGRRRDGDGEAQRGVKRTDGGENEGTWEGDRPVAGEKEGNEEAAGGH